MPNNDCDLSVFIVSRNDLDDWAALLHRTHSILKSLHIRYEILAADSGLDRNSRKTIEQNQCRLVPCAAGEYGIRLRTAIGEAAGSYLVTVDSRPLESLDFIIDLWAVRESAEIVLGSRYIPGGRAAMPEFRRIVSRLSNIVFSRGLDLQIQDMSSGFRIYKGQVVKGLALESKDYEILQEILVKALMMGYQIREIPFRYRSRESDVGRAARFGLSYVKAFMHLWKLRNSIASADYDARAYDALMPPQRYWQRQRFIHITQLLRGQQKCLDVGCGSSRIIGALPQGSVALDILIRKLRYARRFARPVVQGSLFQLPVPSQSFPCILCSQVIEHVPRPHALDELDRALEPGGLLILGTPDYGKWQWLVIEWLYKVILPQAYADEHITHYTYDELVDEFVARRGYRLEAARYILKGELILALRKPL
jgi:SAM-dependent methyltransferase